jgi:hypothetical protein
MDRSIRKPSELPQDQQQHIQEHFDKGLLSALNGGSFHFNSTFGVWGKLQMPSLYSPELSL